MLLGERNGGSWSREDDIAFERALAIYTDENENIWEKIATFVPGKTLEQIMEHYKILVHDVMMIESGCVPLPDYDLSEQPNDKEVSVWECDQKSESKPKQKRRKGIAWTANEHRLFLLGLDKYGKGDWRSISRNFVVTRTPTQVASHAQKHFARLNSKNKNKNRPSIHVITWPNTQATSQPSLDLPTYGTPSLCNTQSTSQPSLDRPVYGTPTIWNTQAALQPSSLNIPSYGTPAPTIGQPMVRPVVLPFGSDMNRLAPLPMSYGVQHHSVPYSSVPSAPLNMGAAPYNMTYIP